jgi:hypothetical protein
MLSKLDKTEAFIDALKNYIDDQIQFFNSESGYWNDHSYEYEKEMRTLLKELLT